MKAVAPHAGLGQFLRQREHLRDRRVRAVAAVSKQATCGRSGARSNSRADRREIVRLVQRRERHELLQLGHDRRVDPHRRGIVGAAMHDAMADRGEVVGRRRR